jgi:hypothetical protein
MSMSTAVPRDLFAMTKEQRNPAWESTSDALQGLGRNPMALQFRTNSITAIKPRTRPAPNVENQQLNSPPQARPASPCTPATAAFERRIQNPTRSPVPRRSAAGPSAEASATLAAECVAATAAFMAGSPAVAAAPVAATVVPAPAMVAPASAIESMFDNSSVGSMSTVHVDTPAPASRKLFAGKRKARVGGKTVASPAKGPSVLNSPGRDRRKTAAAKRLEAEGVFGVRNRGSSDKLIREQSDNRSKACTELRETEKRFQMRLTYMLEVAEAMKRDGTIVSDEEFKVRRV